MQISVSDARTYDGAGGEVGGDDDDDNDNDIGIGVMDGDESPSIVDDNDDDDDNGGMTRQAAIEVSRHVTRG